MTKNAKFKKMVREIAQEKSISYTAALREVQEAEKANHKNQKES